VRTDGSIGAISQVGAISGDGNVITQNYEAHREEADAQFERLKETFRECEESTRMTLIKNTDRLIEAIRRGKRKAR
jgi:hypothetical protein